MSNGLLQQHYSLLISSSLDEINSPTSWLTILHFFRQYGIKMPINLLLMHMKTSISSQAYAKGYKTLPLNLQLPQKVQPLWI